MPKVSNGDNKNVLENKMTNSVQLILSLINRQTFALYVVVIKNRATTFGFFTFVLLEIEYVDVLQKSRICPNSLCLIISVVTT